MGYDHDDSLRWFILPNRKQQNQKPSGPDTAQVPRPKQGNVLYGGAGIYECVNIGDIALTFDDGPYIYTGDLLDKLKVSMRLETVSRLEVV